jgi:hypothetical protein
VNTLLIPGGDMLDEKCDRCGLTPREAGVHYHCGRCDHPEATSMLGHYLNGGYECEARGGKVLDFDPES